MRLIDQPELFFTPLVRIHIFRLPLLRLKAGTIPFPSEKETLEQRNRRILLGHIENAWIKGVLEAPT